MRLFAVVDRETGDFTREEGSEVGEYSPFFFRFEDADHYAKISDDCFVVEVEVREGGVAAPRVNRPTRRANRRSVYDQVDDLLR